MGLIPGSGRSPEGENGNPLQCSCLGNPRDRGTWQATVHGVTKSRTVTEHMYGRRLGDGDFKISPSPLTPQQVYLSLSFPIIHSLKCPNFDLNLFSQIPNNYYVLGTIFHSEQNTQSNEQKKPKARIPMKHHSVAVTRQCGITQR